MASPATVSVGTDEDREGNLWIATSDGLDCLRDLKAARYSNAEGLASTEVDGVIALRNGDVLLSGDMSLHSIYDGKVKSLRFGEGLPGRLAAAVLEDHAGRLWMGIDDGRIRSKMEDSTRSECRMEAIRV